ncbi:unnamed protein product [Cuscuta campestris]|uniref:Uncharacterized protein n=1 Tax=Cuscuta campestris TaxID=132261 RepID=A0A484MGW0_9ASTE|nr:unnamed protein product [Cuscuta campestris]
MELEDRISTFLDDILLMILSLLTFKEAVATSILSRRWRYLWASLPILDFRFEYVLQHEDIHYRNFIRHCRLLEVYKDRFVEMVNQVPRFRKGQGLQEFGIHYPLEQSSSCHIDRWVAFAIAVGVSKLELNLSPYLSNCPRGWKNYSIPHDLFGRTNGMEQLFGQLDRCFLSNPTSSLNVRNGFKYLKELSLKYVDLTDEHFEAILSSCTSLERLHLLKSNKLVSVKHTLPHTKLNFLEIYHCYNVEKVEIFAPNLVSFLYRGAKIHIFVKGAKQLVNLCMYSYSYWGEMEYPHNNCLGLPYMQSKDFVFVQFAEYLSQLEHLTLDVGLFNDKEVFEKVPILSNLKHLSLTSDNDYEGPFGVVSCYRTVVCLVKASPCLCRLDLHFALPPSKNPELRRIPMSPHKYLKEVLVSGFYGNELVMDLIMSISEFAIELQKIEITMAFLGDLSRCPPIIVRDADVAKKSIGELHQKLPADVQVCFLDDD